MTRLKLQMLQNAYDANVQHAEAFIATVKEMPQSLAAAMFAQDFDVRSLSSPVGTRSFATSASTMRNAAAHAAWSEFFTAVYAYHLYDARVYSSIIKDYMFIDTYKRNVARDDGKLLPFTKEEAQRVYNKYFNLLDTDISRPIIEKLLFLCAADYRKAPSVFKRKMTLRHGADRYNNTVKELLAVILIYSANRNLDLDINVVWSSFRSHDETVTIPSVIEHTKHANGNATLVFSDDFVSFLNGVISA